MYLYKRANGIWYVAYTEDEKTKRQSTGKTKKSEAWEYVRKNKIEDKEKFRPENITLYQFSKLYEEYAEISYTTNYSNNIKHHFKHLLNHFGRSTLLSNISRQMAETYLLNRYRKGKYLAHQAKRTLASAFRKAIEWKYIKVNPFTDIKLPKLPKNNPNIIGVDELKLIMAEAPNESLEMLFFCAFFTGMRRGELINLRWQEVDFKDRSISVKNYEDFTVKNKEERRIPMAKGVRTRLSRLKKTAASEYVFCKPDGTRWNKDYVTHAFIKARRDSGIEQRVRLHDTRHSILSLLAKKNYSLYLIGKFAGHKDYRTTQRYAHVQMDDLRDAVNSL